MSYIKVEVLKAFNLKLKLEFLKNVLRELFKSSFRFKRVLKEERLSESQVTPRLTLITNINNSNQSLYVTIKPPLIIISFIMSYFKESLIIFTGVTVINPSFYFKSLFNNVKPFKSGLLQI